jgi:hypothetical protein
MNWLRTLLGLTGVMFSIKALDTFYKTHSWSAVNKEKTKNFVL